MAPKLDVRVAFAEQDLRRGRPLETMRRINERQKRRDERHADAGTRPSLHAAGGSVLPGPSERCIMTEFVQRPNL